MTRYLLILCLAVAIPGPAVGAARDSLATTLPSARETEMPARRQHVLREGSIEVVVDVPSQVKLTGEEAVARIVFRNTTNTEVGVFDDFFLVLLNERHEGVPPTREFWMAFPKDHTRFQIGGATVLAPWQVLKKEYDLHELFRIEAEGLYALCVYRGTADRFMAIAFRVGQPPRE